MSSSHTQRTRTLRIGAGASYAGDRVEPATELAARWNLDYLVYETLASGRSHSLSSTGTIESVVVSRRRRDF